MTADSQTSAAQPATDPEAPLTPAERMRRHRARRRRKVRYQKSAVTAVVASSAGDWARRSIHGAVQTQDCNRIYGDHGAHGALLHTCNGRGSCAGIVALSNG